MVAMSKRTLVRFIEAVQQHPILYGIPLNFVFCSVVGLAIGYFNHQWIESIATSYCIGYSIMLCQFLGHRMGRKFNPIVVTIISLLIGFLVGEVIAGFVVFADPWFMFAYASYGAVLGLIVGSIAILTIYGLGMLASTSLQLVRAETTLAQQAHALAVAELKALQAQVEPHFLFNTLSNIHSLIHSDPAKAQVLLEKVTQFLRTTLTYSRTGDATLGDEIDLISAYLDVQVVRLGERLDYATEIDPELLGFKMPPFLIQPLVENAVIHGIEPKASGGRITIKVSNDANTCQVLVTDTGVGLRENHTTRAGSGLQNIRDRLKTLFTTGATLDITSNHASGTVATLVIPKPDGA